MKSNLKIQPEQDQTIGAAVSLLNEERLAELRRELDRVDYQEALQVGRQDEALEASLRQVSKIREFLGDESHILGRADTKHGEIAEHVEVGIRNARSLLEQKEAIATMEGVGRTAPEDYLIGGVDVQSKFLNGTNNTLKSVLGHMEEYQYFGRDGSYYHIPEDQYEIAIKIHSGSTVDGLNEKSIAAIRDKIREIEQESGKSFGEVVRPAISRYDEVQKGVVFKTVDGHEEALQTRNEDLKGEIRQKSEAERGSVAAEHGPSWAEAGKVGAIGAGIGAAFGVGLCIYKKHKDGRRLADFDSDDWKDVGVEFTKGGVKGGVSGVAIYGITNFTNVGAPLASAFVSATFGITSLAKSYIEGGISLDQFSEQGQALCFDTGVVALGATVGQALIPIPIVGTLIGSFAARTLLSIAKDTLGEETKKLQEKFDREYQALLARLDQAYRIAVQEIVEKYERLGGITRMAFDFEKNAIFRLEASVALAREHQVEEKQILKNVEDVDAFILA